MIEKGVNKMLYYKTNKHVKIYTLKEVFELNKDELLTKKELSKHNISESIIKKCFHEINISKNKIYFWFGSRYQVN